MLSRKVCCIKPSLQARFIQEARFPRHDKRLVLEWLSSLHPVNYNPPQTNPWKKKKTPVIEWLHYKESEHGSKRKWITSNNLSQKLHLIYALLLNPKDCDYENFFAITAALYHSKGLYSRPLRVLISTQLRRYIKAKDAKRVAAILELLKLDELDQSPEEKENEDFLFGAIILAYSHIGDVKSARYYFDLHYSLVQNGANCNYLRIYVFNALIGAYAKRREYQSGLELASEIFTRQHVLPNTKTYNLLIDSQIRSMVDRKDVFKTALEMKELGIKYDSETHGLIISMIDQYPELFEYYNSNKRSFTERTLTELASQFARFNNFATISVLLVENRITNLLFNRVLMLCLLHRNLQMFHNIRAHGAARNAIVCKKVSNTYRHLTMTTIQSDVKPVVNSNFVPKPIFQS